MQVNLPLTQNCVEMSDDAFVMTKTDLAGVITSVNEDFLELSGFRASDLIGRTHSVLRHLDMPREAYEDLWRTLKAGRQWDGMMKNRCKNGDYFWVETQITPQRKYGEIVGYVACRKKMSAQKIKEFENIYRLFRENKAGEMYFSQGEVIRHRGLLKRLQDMLPKLELAAGAVVALVLAKLLLG